MCVLRNNIYYISAQHRESQRESQNYIDHRDHRESISIIDPKEAFPGLFETLMVKIQNFEYISLKVWTLQYSKRKKTEAVVQRCSMKKSVLWNFAKFTGKRMCQSLFFNKVAVLILPWLIFLFLRNSAYKILKGAEDCVEIATEVKKCSTLKDMPIFNVLWNFQPIYTCFSSII